MLRAVRRAPLNAAPATGTRRSGRCKAASDGGPARAESALDEEPEGTEALPRARLHKNRHVVVVTQVRVPETLDPDRPPRLESAFGVEFDAGGRGPPHRRLPAGVAPVVEPPPVVVVQIGPLPSATTSTVIASSPQRTTRSSGGLNRRKFVSTFVTSFCMKPSGPPAGPTPAPPDTASAALAADGPHHGGQLGVPVRVEPHRDRREPPERPGPRPRAGAAQERVEVRPAVNQRVSRWFFALCCKLFFYQWRTALL